MNNTNISNMGNNSYSKFNQSSNISSNININNNNNRMGNHN